MLPTLSYIIFLDLYGYQMCRTVEICMKLLRNYHGLNLETAFLYFLTLPPKDV